MDNLSKALLTGTVLFGMGTTQPTFAQNKSGISDSMLVEIQKNSKNATFETKTGSMVTMSKYEDAKSGAKMLSMGTNIREHTVSISHSKVLGGGTEFIVTYVNLKKMDGMITITGSDGKVESYVGLSSREDAEDIYAGAIVTAVINFGDAIKSGKTIKMQLRQSDIEEIITIFVAEGEKCLPAFQKAMEKQDSVKVQRQKFTPPKDNGEPLHKSANYKEAARGIQTAMKARDRQACNMPNPVRIRNRLPARV